MALFNFAFAKRHGGQFILRIEDTDQSRSSSESEAAIFEALRWAGLAYDEGPDAGGDHGPYRQSERTAIYREHCTRLVAEGHAYLDFATPEQLEELRQSESAGGGDFRYTGQLAPDPAEAARRASAGEPHVVRLRVPGEGECVFNDRLRGEIRIAWNTVDHQVLMKSDGFPTYHLANVVDDRLMEISHVIRGEEWINSTPKHVLLYEAFGWEPPEFVHLPLLRNPDKSKLSKRKNPTSVGYYRRAGFLPEALVNYLGLMGYAMPDEREMFSLEEFVAEFDIDRISLGGPIFDVAKLSWLNARYIREKLTADQLHDRLREWVLNDETWRQILPLAQPRAEKLTDLIPMTAYLFSDEVGFDVPTLLPSKLDGDAVARLVRIALWELEKERAWTVDNLKARLEKVAETEGVKMRDLLRPFFRRAQRLTRRAAAVRQHGDPRPRHDAPPALPRVGNARGRRTRTQG